MDTRPAAAVRLGGELVVIVVGVLIALWADGWVAERSARRVEATRVEALRANLTETISRLSVARREAEEAGDALRTVIEAPPGANVADSVIAIGLLYGTADFNPEMNVYEDLKSSGELALLRNTRLRIALARMEATLERVRLHQADLLNVQQLNYDPFAIADLNLVRLIGPKLALEATDVGPTDPPDPFHVQNLAVFKLNLVVDLLTLYDDAAAALTEALEAASTGSA